MNKHIPPHLPHHHISYHVRRNMNIMRIRMKKTGRRKMICRCLLIRLQASLFYPAAKTVLVTLLRMNMHGQRNTAPCTDTLDIDKPISLEELAADTHSFIHQSSSTSPPPLSINPIQIPNGHKSKSSPRLPPFTLFIERQDDEARNFVSSTDTLDNNLLIIFPQSEE